ncbi:DNA mismatch repair protein MutL [Artomyces pyxidatus]|uniref:DNA mismatch repair protein MutL n=1 Tax=Artomyces pyxidatus TaxID=48021 RepID=A0ACB8TGG0_9AGAM|nr:DNA mismatch repair protein MutL [Artomyces pyxidatus]
MSQESSLPHNAVKPIDQHAIHQLTSGQVVIDLQTAVKELVENSLDAKATNIEVRFKDYGLKSIEVIDNGTGIGSEDFDSIGLKHHTSKLAAFEDLTSVTTFGFRGEALSSLCALSASVVITTATAHTPFGTILELNRDGTVKSRSGKVARQRGTTVSVSGLFTPLPVRRKELERNVKREFGKALHLLNAYALVPCTHGVPAVLLSVSNTVQGKKSVQLRTDGSDSLRAAVSALWGPKMLENIVELNLDFDVETERSVLRRRGQETSNTMTSGVRVRGLISKFSVGGGRTGIDRQFFYINHRPCNISKVQKALNEVYRTFNMHQSPFIVADFILPPDSCDINVSPDKRTILLHSESSLIEALKHAVTDSFSSSRSTFTVNTSQAPSKPSGPERINSQLVPFVEENRPYPAQTDEHPLSHGIQQNPKTHPVPLSGAQDEVRGIEESGGELGVSASGVDDVLNSADQPSRNSDPLRPTLSTTAKSSSFDNLNLSPIRPSRRDPDNGITDRCLDGRRDGRSSFSGRTPARVESILVGHEQKAKTRQVQTVLDTSGASWNLQRSVSTDRGEPPKKKVRQDDVKQPKNASSTSDRRGVRATMREHLKGFASSGSQPASSNVDEEDDGEDRRTGDGDEEMDTEREEPATEIQEARGQLGDSDEPMDIDEKDHTQPSSSHDTTEIDELQDTTSCSAKTPPAVPDNQDVIDLTEEGDDDIPMETRAPLDHSSSLVPETSHGSSKAVQMEILRTDSTELTSAVFDIDRVTRAWRGLHERLSRSQVALASEPSPSAMHALRSKAGVTTSDADVAGEALTRVLHKDDFHAMEVIGQFNLGFIITRLQKPCGTAGDPSRGVGSLDLNDDLFIVDQHAADEKYNFETLQQTTKIESQRLYRPRVLELTAADELVAIDNIDILKQNGFEIEVEDGDSMGERRIKLTAQPVSKNTVFDVQDLEELLHLLQDRPTGTMVRCSKARSMFAMRACRKSTMVGAALQTKQMTAIVRHMGAMEQPWNCPHGRPTMRHLSDISPMKERSGNKQVDWAAFGPFQG